MVLPPIGASETDRALFQQLTWRDWRPTLAAAVFSALAVAILILAFGSVSTVERPVALASLTNSVLWIAAAFIGACGTIAALMLTTVSLLDRLETRLMPARVLFHLRLTVLGALSTMALAVGALLLTIFPLAGGVDVHPPGWEIDVVYFGLLGSTALMVGTFSIVLTSLYATVADVLRSVPQSWVKDILAQDEGGERLEQVDPVVLDGTHVME